MGACERRQMPYIWRASRARRAEFRVNDREGGTMATMTAVSICTERSNPFLLLHAP